MATLTDLAVAAGIMILFLAFIIYNMVGYINVYSGASFTSELQGLAKAVFTQLFTSKGLPTNWESSTTPPLKVGLVENLYRTPIVIKETNGTERGNVSINVTVSFDNNCINTTTDTTLVVYDNNNTYVPAALFNETNCTGGYLNQSDIVFFSTLNASQTRTFYVYSSADKNVTVSRPSISYPTTANYTATVYPPEFITQVSAAKLLALNSTNYTQFLQTLPANYKFNITVTKP